jgi:hypothetical protein
MAMTCRRIRNVFLIAFIVCASRPCQAEQPAKEILVGVNYFAGWWEPLPNKWHDPVDGSDWRLKYPGRVPTLGSFNTQATMDEEITVAAAHGVDFFSILWYPIPAGVEVEENVRHVNAGLAHFMASPQAEQMRFMVEICNHPPFTITTDEAWEDCIRTLLPAFRHPSYLRVGGRRVVKIHSNHHFALDNGMDTARQQARLDRLRLAVKEAGLGDLLIGCGVTAGLAIGRDWPHTRLYDFTNTYMGVPEIEARPEDHPYDRLAQAVQEWNRKAVQSALPYVPFIAAGWNPRPWRDRRPSFTFPTRMEFAAQLRQVMEDLKTQPNAGLPLPGGGRQKAFTIYAWNEFGEGGIVAPTQGEGMMKLEAIAEVFGRKRGSAQPER